MLPKILKITNKSRIMSLLPNEGRSEHNPSLQSRQSSADLFAAQIRFRDELIGAKEVVIMEKERELAAIVAEKNQAIAKLEDQASKDRHYIVKKKEEIHTLKYKVSKKKMQLSRADGHIAAIEQRAIGHLSLLQCGSFVLKMAQKTLRDIKTADHSQVAEMTERVSSIINTHLSRQEPAMARLKDIVMKTGGFTK